MLEAPPVLLLNCLGSYFYCITNHLSKNNTSNVVLSYLSFGRLVYRSISNEDFYRLYLGNNPWNYQPIAVLDINNQPLEINDAFFAYLSNVCNIKVFPLDAHHIDFPKCINLTDNKTSFLICTVDEFYLPCSKFYSKLHNKHYVLIKEIFEDGQIEIIDSEKKQTCKIAMCEMEFAVRESIYKKKIIYHVDGTNYKEHLSKSKLHKKHITLNHDYLQGLITDVEINRRESFEKSRYCFEGYYYAILSKIIPYYQMIVSNLQEDQNKTSQLYTEITRNWKELIKIMRLNIFRGDYNYDYLLKRLNDILLKQKAIDHTLPIEMEHR